MESYRRKRAEKWALAFVVMSLATACGESHYIDIEGERYSCKCTYERRIPCSGACMIGDPECDIECGPGATVDLTDELPLSPCSVIRDDVLTVCDQACRDKEPEFTVSTSVDLEASGYDGPGLCEDDDGYFWTFPNIPSDAVRAGWVVGDESQFRLAIEDVGDTGFIQPEDGDPVAIVDGICETTADCPMTLTELLVSATDFNIGDEHVSRANLRITGGEWEFLVDARPSEASDLYREVDPTHRPEMEVHADVPDVWPEGMDSSFEWTSAPTGLEDDEISMREGAADQFMRFNAVASGEVEGRAVVLEVQLMIRFYSGSPVPHLLVYEEPTADGLILDGSGTWDEWGGGPDRYRWLIRQGTDTSVVAIGPVAKLPAHVWLSFLGNPDPPLICLLVEDTDGLQDERCIDPSAIEPEPPADIPCLDVGASFPYASDFGQLLRASGLEDYIASLDGGTTMLVPADPDLDDEYVSYLLDPAHIEELQEFVLNHVFGESIPYDELEERLAGATPESGNEVDTAGITDDVVTWDITCGDGGYVHVSTRPLGAP